MSMSGENPITTAIWEALFENKDEESKCCFSVLLEKNYLT